jgi:nucleotide-binding universal stress UspA family protein
VLRFGKLLADATKAEVAVLHVVDDDEDEATSQAIRAAVNAEMGDTPHSTRLESGPAAEVILQIAEEGQYDLILVGARHTPSTEQPVGRVARQVAVSAPVSVLVVKGQPTSLERLLVCSGGRPIAEPVIQKGAALAEATKAKATLLHVSSAVPSMYTGLEAMEETIEEFLGRDSLEAQHLRHGAEVLQEHGVEAALELRHGVAADEIMRSTQLRDYDLIVIGASDAASPLNRLFFGELTQRILDLSPVPVLIARNDTAS